MNGKTTAAVVVTCNRRTLLERCLTAISKQTRKPDRVTIADNVQLMVLAALGALLKA